VHNKHCPWFNAQASPELQKLFGEDPDANDALAQFPAPPAKTARGMPAAPPAGAGGIRALPGKSSGMDTPRGFEEELTEEELVKRELEKVKREREVLLTSIVAAREQAGDLGWEADSQ
jgi:hypothetical protein